MTSSGTPRPPRTDARYCGTSSEVTADPKVMSRTPLGACMCRDRCPAHPDDRDSIGVDALPAGRRIESRVEREARREEDVVDAVLVEHVLPIWVQLVDVCIPRQQRVPDELRLAIDEHAAIWVWVEPVRDVAAPGVLVE